MGLFRRRPAGAPGDAVASFWAWWAAEGRRLAEQSVDGDLDQQSFAATMTEHVGALGDLSWELARGEGAAHVLLITAEGDPARRGAARRAVLGAPDVDATWSYLDSRPPVADPESVVVNLDDLGDIDFARVSVSARMSDGRFDVQLHHPSFADLSVEGRATVALLALHSALGEVDTELWLDEVHPAELPPLDGFGLTALRAVVQDLKRQRLDADGQPGWVMLRGETEHGSLVVMTRSPLHPLTAPHLDTYAAVTLPYAHRTEDGLPDEGSLEPLRDFESHLALELGRSGLVVAHLSNAGTRTLHTYLDSTADLLPAVRTLARTWGQGRANVHHMPDPQWRAVSHLGG